jgi:antitoxin component YwqK of YwqJK toxin-antitoxin module
MKCARAIGFSMLLVLILGAWAPLDARELKFYQYLNDNGILIARYTYYEMTGAWIKHGTDTTWRDDGAIYEQTEYRDGRKQGTYTWWGYDDDGKQFIQESGDYVNDIKEGEWYGTSPYNGKIRFSDVYDNGQVISSKSWEYSGDGTLVTMQTAELESGDWRYHVTGYYPNGNIYYEISKEAGAQYWICTSFYGYMDEPTGVFEQGLLTAGYYDRWFGAPRQGLWAGYYSNGVRYSLTEYSEGVKNGVETLYDSDGLIKQETQYSYGSHHGKEKFYSGGVLILSYNYVDDILEGEQLEFSSGQLSGRYKLKDGELNGKYEQWWDNGNPSIVMYYAGGRREGASLTYHKNGRILSQSTYKDDALHGPSTTYYESGGIEYQGAFMNGNYVGIFTKYWEDGTIDYTMTYQDGNRHGEYTSYMVVSNPDPPDAPVTGGPYIQEQGSYCNGSRCGTWIYGRLEPILTAPYTYPIIGWTYVTSATDYNPVVYNTTTPNPYPPPAVQQNKEIRGRVKRADTGRPIAGVKVQVGGDSVSTDSTGYYSIQKAPLDAYDVSFSKDGFSGHREAVDMKDKSYKTVNALLSPKSASLPAVTKVDSQYGGIFLQSIPITNAYTASVNWGGTDPGTVHFRVNGTDNAIAGNSDGAVKTFNMGSDLTASLSSKGNTIKVTAENMNGTSPNALTLNPIVIPIPTWSASLGLFTFEIKDGIPAYGLEKQWPEKPLAIQISEASLGPTLWTAWGFFPLIGGKEFGIPPTQFSMGVKVKTDGSGAVSAGGKMGFAVAGTTIEGKVKGTGNVKYLSEEGLVWTGASLESGLKDIVKRDIGPVELIPALAGATGLWGVGPMVQWFNNTAKIQVAFNVAADLKLGVVNNNGEISFNPAEEVMQTGIDLGLGSEFMGFKANLSGGGAAKLFWQVPAPADSGYFKRAEVEISAKLDVAWKLFKNTFEMKHTLLGGPSPLSMEGPGKSSTGFQPISRDFLNLGPYNRFAAPAARAGMRTALSGEAQTTTDITLVTNIYPYAEPAVAGLNDKLAIAYVYNNPDKPELQATEIYATYFDGTKFSVPASIRNVTTDNRAEFAPTLAFDSNGKVVCVWERVKNVAFTGGRPGGGTADMAAMAAELEIVYAVYDPEGGTWSEPSALTDNNYLDFRPMLKRGDDGSLLLVWQSNTGNLTMGTAEHPTRIYSALWNASAMQFEPLVQQSSEDFINVFDFSVAYKGPNALLAFAKDEDGDFSTTTDQEISTALFDGTAWATSSAITFDAVPNSNPRVLYSISGNKELVWRKGDSLVRLTNWNTNSYETIRTDCFSPTFSDFRLFRDPQDRLALIWQDVAAEKIDLFFLVYDSSKSSWSKDLRLTNDAPLEKDFQGFFSPDGKLHLAYVKEDRGTTINDLHYLTYQLKANLSVSGQNMGTDPQNPAPGSAVSLSCRVDNVGDTAFSNVAVDFYLGDPNSGGQLIGRSVVSEIKAGASGSASVTWNVPANLNSYVVYAVVDPDNSAQEANEGNNTAFFSPILPDLVALQCRPQDLGDGSVDVTAVVKNTGAVPATGVEVLYKVNGSAIGVVTLPEIKPGETAEISRLIWSGSDFSGEQPEIEVLVDPAGQTTTGPSPCC